MREFSDKYSLHLAITLQNFKLALLVNVVSLSCSICSTSVWTQQTFVLMKTFWRRLDQDEYVRLSLTSSEDVFKTFWSRPIYSSWPYVFKTSSRRLQDILKTFSKRLQDVLENVFKTSSRRLQDVLQRYLEVELFLLTRLWEAFNTFLRVSFPKTIIYRGICPGNTTSDKFMASVQNLQEREKFLKF